MPIWLRITILSVCYAVYLTISILIYKIKVEKKRSRKIEYFILIVVEHVIFVATMLFMFPAHVFLSNCKTIFVSALLLGVLGINAFAYAYDTSSATWSAVGIIMDIILIFPILFSVYLSQNYSNDVAYVVKDDTLDPIEGITQEVEEKVYYVTIYPSSLQDSNSIYSSIIYDNITDEYHFYYKDDTGKTVEDTNISFSVGGNTTENTHLVATKTLITEVHSEMRSEYMYLYSTEDVRYILYVNEEQVYEIN